MPSATVGSASCSFVSGLNLESKLPSTRSGRFPSGGMYGFCSLPLSDPRGANGSAPCSFVVFFSRLKAGFHLPLISLPLRNERKWMGLALRRSMALHFAVFFMESYHPITRRPRRAFVYLHSLSADTRCMGGVSGFALCNI